MVAMPEVGQEPNDDIIPTPEVPEDELPIHPSVTEESEDVLVGRLEAVRCAYAEQRDEIDSAWELSRAIYDGQRIGDNGSLSEYVDREVFREVEAMKALASELVFPPGDHWFKYEPAMGDEADKTEAAASLVRKQINDSRIRSELYKWLDNVHMWGVSFLRYGWERFRADKHKIARAHADKDVWKRDAEEEYVERPALEWVSHEKVYLDRRVDRPEDSPFVFIEQRVSGTYLKTQVRNELFDEENVRKILDDSPDKGGGLLRMQQAVKDEKDVREELLDLIPDDREFDEVEVFTNDGWRYVMVDGVLVHANRNPLGKAPLLALRAYPQADEFYGLGEPMLLAGVHMQLQDVSSLWMDAATFNNMPMFKVRKTARNDWLGVEFEPGRDVFVDNMDDVEPLNKETGATFNLGEVRDALKRDAQLTTSLTSEVMGTGSDHNTASGLARLQNAASKRIGHKVKLFVPVLEELYKVLHGLNARYLPQEVKLRAEGADGLDSQKTVSPSDFSYDVDVLVNVAPAMESKEKLRSDMQVLWTMIGQDPRFNLKPIAEQLLRAFGVKDPSRVWGDVVQTQLDVQKAILTHTNTGYMPEAQPTDNHEMWATFLGMYMQTPPFQALDQVQQFTVQSRMQQHLVYLGQVQGANLAGTPNTTPEASAGEAVPGSETAANDETGSRLAGANAVGAGSSAVESGGF